jgi:hypothetical protein
MVKLQSVDTRKKQRNQMLYGSLIHTHKLKELLCAELEWKVGQEISLLKKTQIPKTSLNKIIRFKKLMLK